MSVTPIEAAIAKRDALEKQIADLITDYEKETGLQVLEIYYEPTIPESRKVYRSDVRIAVGLPPKERHGL